MLSKVSEGDKKKYYTAQVMYKDSFKSRISGIINKDGYEYTINISLAVKE